jgi:acyl-coenzyme A thioesterase PaaI-like protein
MPPGAAVLSVEFKINLLAPAVGDRIVARGRVIRAGKTVTVCWGDVTAYAGDSERLVATMVGTMMTVRDRGLTD